MTNLSTEFHDFIASQIGYFIIHPQLIHYFSRSKSYSLLTFHPPFIPNLKIRIKTSPAVLPAILNRKIGHKQMTLLSELYRKVATATVPPSSCWSFFAMQLQYKTSAFHDNHLRFQQVLPFYKCTATRNMNEPISADVLSTLMALDIKHVVVKIN